MHLKKLEISNFGPYAGKHVIDFDTQGERNVILIGGNNGSGKTSLFNALKIALFGSHAYGYATNANTYIMMLKRMLNNNQSQNEVQEYCLSVTYEVVERRTRNVYEIHRSWDVENNLEEHVQVTQNDVSLSPGEKETFFQELKTIISPNLIDSIMFDGEQVASLVDKNHFSEHLKHVFNDCFNFSIFNNFNNDLWKYLEKYQEQQSMTNDELNLLKNKQDVKTTKKQISFLSQKISALEKEIKNDEIYIDNQLNKVKSLGGLTKTEIEKTKQSINESEQRRKDVFQSVKNFLDNYYVFAINSKLLKETITQMKKELPYSLANQLRKLENDNETMTSEMNQFMQKYSAHSSEVIHKEASANTIDELEALYNNSANEERLKDHYRSFCNITEESTKHYDKRKALLLSTENKEIIQLTEEISQRSEDVSHKREELDSLQNEKDELMVELNHLKDQVEKFEKNVYNTTKKSKSFITAQNLLKINEAYIKKETERQVYLIEKLALKAFNEVTNKANYISYMNINPSTFDITLYGSDNQMYSMDYLSAGEKQIMIAAIIKSIIDLSKRRLPFVFDTPLARLDAKNRISFAKNIIQSISSQVIILSTDEEFVGSTLSSISDYISKRYLLQPYSTNETKVKTNEFFERRGAA